MDSKDDPRNLPPYCWLDDAKIYNHDYKKVPTDRMMEGGDIVVLYFSLRGIDKDDIMHQFYEIYENAKYINLPIEVINVPMDETKDDMCTSYDEQANWFTFMFDDPTIVTLLYRYEISAVPHLVVTKTDGTVVSTHGILDLHEYGKNALMTWLSNSAGTMKPKRLSKDVSMYGLKWNYLHVGDGKATSPAYRRKFVYPSLSDNIICEGGLACW